MNRLVIFILALICCVSINGQVTLGYYMPKEISYNQSIPTPKQFFGHEVGEWHLTHDKLYFYMLELSKLSDRAIWEEYGRSYEGRPLGQLIISSPENIKNLEQLRQQHLLLCDPSKSDNADVKNMPVFIKLGYGVHGNESSGQNASALTAYYLIAGVGSQIDEILKNEVILIDPALNPDGMQRHSTWVNFAKSLDNNPDPNSWEFSEPFPGGRTNHYWFDLNRDYIMLQHPESIGRVAAFYRWRPNINNDHHEQGPNATFFFQPGIQSRNNPLTPAGNQELTAEIGKFHEKYLNSIGSLYFTEESYDDFYVGKGSSYPDIHGSVGILYEQAGVKGHSREVPGGILTFPFAIRNQFTVSLSTIEAGLKMKEKLLDSQRRFYKDAISQADKYPVKAFIFTEPSDNARTGEFIKNLLRHQIKVYRMARDITKNGVEYKSESSYVVPLKQNEYLFVRSLFEPVKEFTDSTFYDVSTWVLPMSFNIPYTAVSLPVEMQGLTGPEITETPVLKGRLLATRDAYAYLFEWNEYFTPKALYILQTHGVITRVATDKFTSFTGNDKKEFSYGTIMVSAYGQPLSRDEIFTLLESVAKECGITVYGVSTGLTPKGIDLGSNAFIVLKKPSVLMITGEGTNSSDEGEIWHMFDTRFNIPVTMATAARVNSMDLDRYNVLIVTGSPDISPAGIDNIKSWNRKGGTIIAYESGNNWLVRNKLADIEFLPSASNKRSSGIYANRSGDSQVQLIPGSVFEVFLDITNPLCYGYSRTTLPVFKTGSAAAKKDPGIYNNPGVYTANPLLSGYCTKENIERIKNSSFLSIHGNRIISIYDNTNFRAIWFGTNKIFMNAVFFSQIMGGGRYSEGGN
jgi:hypothetical protein